MTAPGRGPVVASAIWPGWTVRIDNAPPQVVLDKWERNGIVHLVFERGTAMLDPDAVVTRL